MRYTPEFYAGYVAYKDGAVGDLVMLYGPKSYDFGESRPDFYKKRETYGGTILWVAVHPLDRFQWTGGDITEVYAAHTLKGNHGYGEGEGAAVISTHFANDTIGTISADYLRTKNSGSHGDDQLRIAGSRGVIEIMHGKPILTNGDTTPRELELKPEDDFFGDFCRSLQGQGTCRLTMEDTFNVSKIALCAKESADTRTLIKL